MNFNKIEQPMNPSDSIKRLAEDALKQGRPSIDPNGPLCIPLGETDLFVADAKYSRVMVLHTIMYQGVEYKVGPMKDGDTFDQY